MKQIILSLMILSICSVSAQKKVNYEYNNFIDLAGTAYTVATVVHLNSKLFTKTKSGLLFINTETGESEETEFPEGARVQEVKQIKIDSLKINLVLVLACTVDANGKKGLDWSDPIQVFIFSPSGKEKHQLTEDNFSASSWRVNEYTGTLLVSGFFDNNKNNKKDKDENSEILLYDLQTLQLKNKI
ncbi:MAG: hypothetical protein LBT04_06740 [Prevotellaceae bacterium]|jgi:hypothetical protein|nr:hypothetical protein [Prevotellaceae bacterium]